jgi:hypothetical protein
MENLSVQILSYVVLIYVIVILLKQLNREREERNTSQQQYRELALRVRSVQLDEEVTRHMDPVEYFAKRNKKPTGPRSTVSEVEGA